MQIRPDAFQRLTSGELPIPGLMEAHSIPGCTMAVIRQGKLVYSNAWGVRDTRGTPMTEGTLFECASLTKSVFTLLALQEVQADKLELDAPIAPLLRDKPWSEDPRFADITPRHCLSHGCGLPNWESRPMQMLFTPGERYSYSGEGYLLLQRLVEQLEGKGMDVLLQERIFPRYGMESSSARWTPVAGAAFSLGFDTDGKVNKVRDCVRTGGVAPEPNAAWSLYSYAADYARFLCGLMEDRGGLSPELFEQMTTQQNSADEHIAWGLGFGIPKASPSVLWHWGDNDGFKSFAVWDKVTGDGAVINTNSDNGLPFYMEVLKSLTDGAFFDDIAAFIRSAE